MPCSRSLLTRSKVAAAADFSPTFVSRLRFSSAVLFSSFSMFAPIFSLPPGGAPGCDASILRPGPAAPLDCSIQACDTWPGGLPCIVLVVGGTVGGGIAVQRPTVCRRHQLSKLVGLIFEPVEYYEHTNSVSAIEQLGNRYCSNKHTPS